jgi:hypothetical protein
MIPKVRMPANDPVYGNNGPLKPLWQKRRAAQLETGKAFAAPLFTGQSNGKILSNYINGWWRACGAWRTSMCTSRIPCIH